MKKLIKIVVVCFIILIGAYMILHAFATAERGYNAFGGETFIFAVPLIAWSMYDNIKELKKERE